MWKQPKYQKCVLPRKVLKNSAESVKYIGGGDYFLLNLTALMHATLYTKRVAFCKTPLFV